MALSSYNDYADWELVVEFKKTANKKVFEELYKRYKNMIYSYVRKFLYRTPADIAGEIMHEIFIKVYLELKSLKNPKAFKLWLYKVARSICLKYIRSQKAVEFSLDSEQFPLPDNLAVDLRVDLEKEYINNELRNLVYKEINKLDKKIREVIILKFFDNLTYEEISKITKMPDRTIRFKLKRIFESISKKLEREGYL